MILRHAPGTRGHVTWTTCALLIGAAITLLPPTARTASAQPPARVEVKGTLLRDGWIEARRIRLREPDRGAKIEGPVVALDAERRVLVIGGLVIALTPDAAIQRPDQSEGSLEEVRAGTVVEAKGRWNGRRLDASRLRVRAPRGPTEAPVDDLEIEADVEWDFDRRRIQVLGYPVGLALDGKLTDERENARTPEADAAVLPVPSTDRLRRDDDEPPLPPIRVGDWLTLGGRVGGDVWNEQQLADAPSADDRRRRGNAVAQAIGSAALGPQVEVYTKVGALSAFNLDEPEPLASGRPRLRLYEAYVLVGATAPVGLQVGRQRFRDDREWFYDDYLDAVRLHVQAGSWRAEAAVAESVFAGPRELRRRSEQRQVLASVSKQVGRRSSAAAFLIARDDPGREERPMWIGGQWSGRIPRSVRTWVVGAVRRGEGASERLGGWAIDTGAAWRLPLPGAPSVAGGYALATGDTAGGDGVDTRFRQTGLDDNRSRFFGVKRFARYGEVFDPELSNLVVWTAGAGLRPFSRTSIDVVYHRYAQHARRRSLPSNRLGATGTGRSTALGDEVDLVVAVQQWRRVDLSMVAGLFRPGEAIVLPARSVVYWKPEFRVFF
jgi:alginate production protein